MASFKAINKKRLESNKQVSMGGGSAPPPLPPPEIFWIHFKFP